ncbi:MAG TPA: DUF2259 domain-containing protein [Leptospiraceae bacterium]|nr:DUF2259 domain-containing protein [Leptospiraceae bacterium]HMW04102.1 DUF2259 domain-containing protein [Leptospiraceae bacterium]HMX30831.1 DUF2259 domain-containing protein [Leptospiraceae bacterium]HMY30095.1 DUF2259 domain-containing protein [Leptospiraceae bacterium]HMZ65467.1 DUF2259 domain-containing protein [Leptospiraceae bacterium]
MKTKWLSILFFPFILFASDSATPHVFGFSKDGSLFAFSESGVQDGSGFPYANGYFIDVEKNVLKEKTIALLFEETDQSYNPDSDAWLKKQIVEEAKKKYGYNLLSLKMETPIKENTFHFQNKKYILKWEPLIQKKYSDKCMGNPELLSIRLVSSNYEKVIQKDKIVPLSRGNGCARNYSFVGIYYFKNSFAAIFSYRYFSFEGDDLRHIAVTWKLD